MSEIMGEIRGILAVTLSLLLEHPFVLTVVTLAIFFGIISG